MDNTTERIAECHRDVLLCFTSKMSDCTPISKEDISIRSCLRTLKELSTLRCTENLLSKTGLRRLVNNIRKQKTLPCLLRHNARSLLRKWRTVVTTPPSVTPPQRPGRDNARSLLRKWRTVVTTPPQRPQRDRNMSIIGKEAAASEERVNEMTIEDFPLLDHKRPLPETWYKCRMQQRTGDTWNRSCAGP